MVKVLADQVSGEGSHSGLQTAIFTLSTHGLESEASSLLSYKGTNAILRTPLMTQLSPKSPSPNTIYRGIEIPLQSKNWGWGRQTKSVTRIKCPASSCVPSKVYCLSLRLLARFS